MIMTARAVVFDVNETMLDLGALDPLFAEWFGDAGARSVWFAQTLHYALTFAATRRYQSFGEIGRAALAITAERRGVVLPGNAVQKLRQQLVRVPAHEDVAPALERLRAAGFRVAALSNNPLAALQEQLGYARLTPLFEEIMSVEEAGALKPAPEVYLFAANRLGFDPDQIWMVAAHGWDIAGAMRAGLHGAFIARPGQLPDPFSPPQIKADDLRELVNDIIDRVPGSSPSPGSTGEGLGVRATSRNQPA